jgi:uncharacterized coiled-coil protein SlyX
MSEIRDRIEELENRKSSMESILDSINDELNELYQVESELEYNNRL